MKYIRLMFVIITFTIFYQSAFSASYISSRYKPHSSKANWLNNQKHWGFSKLALSPNNKEIYAIDPAKGSLSIINISTGTTSKTLSLSPYGINGIVFAQDGKKAYIADSSEKIFIFDTNKQ